MMVRFRGQQGLSAQPATHPFTLLTGSAPAAKIPCAITRFRRSFSRCPEGSVVSARARTHSRSLMSLCSNSDGTDAGLPQWPTRRMVTPPPKEFHFYRIWVSTRVLQVKNGGGASVQRPPRRKVLSLQTLPIDREAVIETERSLRWSAHPRPHWSTRNDGIQNALENAPRRAERLRRRTIATRARWSTRNDGIQSELGKRASTEPSGSAAGRSRPPASREKRAIPHFRAASTGGGGGVPYAPQSKQAFPACRGAKRQISNIGDCKLKISICNPQLPGFLFAGVSV